MYKWYLKWPGYLYAWGPVEFNTKSQRKAREIIRDTYNEGVRLPIGFQCWLA